MRSILSLFVVGLLASDSFAQTKLVDFEDKTLPFVVGSTTYHYYNGEVSNGVDPVGSFTSRGANFNNNFTDFGGGFTGWDGFAYSHIVDTTTAGFGNQYAAYNLDALHPGGDHSPNYGIAFSYNYQGTLVVPSFPRLTLPSGSSPLSMSITNNTYAALSMLNGDSFAKKFGGPSGNDPDFLLLKIQGRDASNNITGTVDFYLADYTTAVKKLVSEWTTVDLSSLPGNTRALTFEITSSDVGVDGINTPTYFALDNLLVAVPEPTTVAFIVMTGLGAGFYGWKRRRGAK